MVYLIRGHRGGYGGGYGVPNPGPPLGPYGLNPNAQVRMEAIGTAWGLIRAQMGTWVVVTLLFWIINTVVQAPFTAGNLQQQMEAIRTNNPSMMPQPNPGLQGITSILSIVVAAFLMPGLYKMALKQIDGEEISVGDLFSGGPYFVNTVLGLILMYIAIILGFCALCVGAFVAMAGLAFTVPLIVDKNLSPVDALSQSWNALKGQILPMLLLIFVSGLCAGLGVLACCVGMLVTYPLIIVTPAVVYREFFPANRTGITPPPGNYPPPPIPSPF